MQLDKLAEELSIAAANGVELDADEQEARKLLALLKRVEARSDERQEKLAASLLASAAAKEQREAAATITFRGTPKAADDIVVVGKCRADHSFRLLHRADGSIEYFGQQEAVVVGARPNIHYGVRDGETLDGHTPRYYVFSDYLTVHYIPRAIYAAVPEHHRNRIRASSSAPTDLWGWSGGVEAHLLNNRDRGRIPTPEELAKAMDAGLSQCRGLVDGCMDGDLLRRWRDVAVKSGSDPNVRLAAMLSDRLAKLGEPLKGRAA